MYRHNRTAICTGLFPPPNRLYMSNVDFVTRQLTFNWSRSSVSPDCPGNSIHYNILASNCGSCPTTTNHTTITCTDVPINGTTCSFAVQTVVCGNVTGNSTNPISVSVNTATATTVTVVTGLHCQTLHVKNAYTLSIAKLNFRSISNPKFHCYCCFTLDHNIDSSGFVSKESFHFQTFTVRI